MSLIDDLLKENGHNLINVDDGKNIIIKTYYE